MKKLPLIIIALVALLSSCSKPKGELVGMYGNATPETAPFGMVFIPRGSYNMGPNDASVAWAIQPNQKTVSIDAFWMDQTEITNGEYKQFVTWVADSIVRRKLARIEIEYEGGDVAKGQFYSILYDPYNEAAEPDTMLNYKSRIPGNLRWEYDGDEMVNEQYKAVNSIYYQGDEKTYTNQINARVINYEYTWVNYDEASKEGNAFNPYSATYEKNASVKIDSAFWRGNQIIDTVIIKPLRHRSDLISKKIINVYPDTMCWMQEFTYSFNEPQMLNYFSHPSYGEYPVVGINWDQAEAFCNWRNNIYEGIANLPRIQRYRLPTEAEWEYAARGGRHTAKYPWGGPYVRNAKGCFMANYKPMRGNYTEDGYLSTSKVGSFDPNDYGLYDMSGNVSEWSSTTYDQTLNTFTLDMNPNYEYRAKNDDPKIMKRKIIKGGSWKDVGAYLQCGVRDFEYQYKDRPSIGFRCVRSYIGD